MVRIDYETGIKPIEILVHMNREIHLHNCQTRKAEDLILKHSGKSHIGPLGIPSVSPCPPLIHRMNVEFTQPDPALPIVWQQIGIGGLGYVGVKKVVDTIKLRLYTFPEVPLDIRPYYLNNEKKKKETKSENK